MKDFKNLHPLDFLRIIWRRRWYALATFILVSLGAGAYAWYVPDVYKSESSIMVESAVISQDYVRPSIRSTPEEQIASIRAQVYSRSFLERMIQEFQLFGYGTSNEFSMDGAVEALGKNIKVTNTSKSTFEISFSAASPQTAQSFTRRVVESLIQSSSSSRKTKAVETDQFIDEQLRQTEQDLAAQEEKIRQFKTAHLGELPEQAVSNLNTLAKLNEQLSSVEDALEQAKERQKNLELRAQEQKLLSIHAQDLPIAAMPSRESEHAVTPTVDPKLQAKEAELAALAARYTPNHPDVVRLSREVEDLKKQAAAAAAEKPELTPLGEEDVSPANGQPDTLASGNDALSSFEESALRFEADSIRSDIAKREKERSAILGQIRAYQAKLSLSPTIEQELAALSREREILQHQYSSLQDKKFQAQMTANLETNKSGDTYRIIDEASLPERPAFPNRFQMIFLGLGAGFVLGIGAALGREVLDTTICSEDEIPAVLKLPVLATISEIPVKAQKRLIKTGGIAKSA
jgi:polysaccharide chain length determinant protein (PEP-CTERM system associated)